MATRRGFRPPGDGEAVAPGAMSSRGGARWRDRGTGRAAGEDLHDPGGEAHQHAELPGAVVGAGPVENQATAIFLGLAIAMLPAGFAAGGADHMPMRGGARTSMP